MQTDRQFTKPTNHHFKRSNTERTEKTEHFEFELKNNILKIFFIQIFALFY